MAAWYCSRASLSIDDRVRVGYVNDLYCGFDIAAAQRTHFTVDEAYT